MDGRACVCACVRACVRAFAGPDTSVIMEFGKSTFWLRSVPASSFVPSLMSFPSFFPFGRGLSSLFRFGGAVVSAKEMPIQCIETNRGIRQSHTARKQRSGKTFHSRRLRTHVCTRLAGSATIAHQTQFSITKVFGGAGFKWRLLSGLFVAEE
jgi:hypothetical protein